MVLLTTEDGVSLVLGCVDVGQYRHGLRGWWRFDAKDRRHEACWKILLRGGGPGLLCADLPRDAARSRQTHSASRLEVPGECRPPPRPLSRNRLRPIWVFGWGSPSALACVVVTVPWVSFGVDCVERLSDDEGHCESGRLWHCKGSQFHSGFCQDTDWHSILPVRCLPVCVCVCACVRVCVCACDAWAA